MIRRLVGFICAIISIVFLVAIVINSFDVFKLAFDTIKETPGEWWSVVRDTVVIFFDSIFKPLVILLLSVVAMGKYHN
jgi:hypothetical protein